MGVRCWLGHHWKTVDEYKVDPVKFSSIEFKGLGAMNRITQLASGYKVIHQECIRCGERRAIHKW